MGITIRPDVFIVTLMALSTALVMILHEGKQPEQPTPSLTEVVEEEEPPSLQQPTLPELKYSNEELRCLALNTYFEARSQSKAGQLATMLVVLNRSESSNFPDDLCEVVTQGPVYENWKGNMLPVRDQCQFSWYCDGMSDVPKEVEKYQEIEKMVYNISYYDIIDFTEGSTHYHAEYVDPDWNKDYQMVVQIDQHIFYKNRDG